MNEILSKTFTAGAAIGASKFVKMGASDGLVIEAVDGAAPIIGVSPREATASGDRIDIQMMGIAKVKSGGTISRGALATASTAGVAVAAAPATGVNAYVAGNVLAASASGDLTDILLAPGIMQGG